MRAQKYQWLLLLAVPIVSIVLHWYVFDLDLVGIHVWRQTETQQVINNFYREDWNIFHPRVNNLSYPDRLLLLEFPIMQWLFAVAHSAMGDSIVVSRVLTFIIGLFSVYGIYSFTKLLLRNATAAVLACWCFAFSPVFHYYTVNPLPDNFSLATAIWSLSFFLRYRTWGKTTDLTASAILLSLAILAKLPFILYSTFIIAYYAAEMSQKKVTISLALRDFAIYTVIAAPALIWYAYAMQSWHGMVVLKGVFDSREGMQGLLYILQGIIASVLPELLINYGSVLFFLASFFFIISLKKYHGIRFIACAAWSTVLISYLLFELNTISTVHDYYMLPFLPPIFLLVGYGASKLLAVEARPIRILAVICLSVIPLTAGLRTYSRWDVATDPGFNKAFYLHKNELRKLTPPNDSCVVGADQSDMVLLYYIDRKGWSYNDRISGAMLSNYIDQGAKYLYCTDYSDKDPNIVAHLAEKIFDKDSLRVYKLKR